MILPQNIDLTRSDKSSFCVFQYKTSSNKSLSLFLKINLTKIILFKINVASILANIHMYLIFVYYFIYAFGMAYE